MSRWNFLIACLYHDIGKLDGAKKHEVVGAKIFREMIAPQLGISDQDIDYICGLIEHHLDAFHHLLEQQDDVMNGRPPEDMIKLGMADLAACYMEFWSDQVGFLEKTVPDGLWTAELIALRGVYDKENWHSRDMLTHSILCYHIANRLYES